jgi:hypothetical protein
MQNYPNWLGTTNMNVDLRGVFLGCNSDGTWYQDFSWPTCYWGTISPISFAPVCYTT